MLSDWDCPDSLCMTRTAWFRIAMLVTPFELLAADFSFSRPFAPGVTHPPIGSKVLVPIRLPAPRPQASGGRLVISIGALTTKPRILKSATTPRPDRPTPQFGIRTMLPPR